MVRGSSPLPATKHRWTRLFKIYTPNGTFGRLLFVSLLGSLGLLSLAFSLSILASASLIWIPIAAIFAGVGLGASLLTAIMLWSIYLSLIDTGQTKSTETDGVLSAEENHNDSLDIVKREYAAGNISEKEFERRVENILHADTESQLKPRTMNGHTRNTIQEANEPN